MSAVAFEMATVAAEQRCEGMSAEGLLAPLSQAQFKEYHDGVVEDLIGGTSGRRMGPLLTVVPDAGDGKGKGVQALRSIREGHTLFRETPLVSIPPTPRQCLERCSLLQTASGPFTGPARP